MIYITFEQVKDMLKQSIDTTTNMNEALEKTVQSIYIKGYNDAKREIALSGEYERAYECGKSDADLPRWIPVSERLPKIADVYRVTRYYPKNVINPKYLVDACAFDGSNTWYNDNRINHERAYADNVIAWQENPEPYKAESEDKE